MFWIACFVIVYLMLLRFNSVDLLLYVGIGGLGFAAMRVVVLIARY